MRFLKATILALLIVSCAPIRVNYDYDKTTNFTNYKTYQYYANMETGLSELDTKRLLNTIDAKMKTKGFTISENPDFFIDIKSQEYQAAQRQTVGVGVGGGGGNVGGGISIGLPIGQANVNRQITIDFVDENKNPPRVVQLDGLVLMKLIKHCSENVPDVVTGQLLGLDVDDKLEVTNCFPVPMDADNDDGSHLLRLFFFFFFFFASSTFFVLF